MWKVLEDAGYEKVLGINGAVRDLSACGTSVRHGVVPAAHDARLRVERVHVVLARLAHFDVCAFACSGQRLFAGFKRQIIEFATSRPGQSHVRRMATVNHNHLGQNCIISVLRFAHGSDCYDGVAQLFDTRCSSAVCAFRRATTTCCAAPGRAATWRTMRRQEGRRLKRRLVQRVRCDERGRAGAADAQAQT